MFIGSRRDFPYHYDYCSPYLPRCIVAVPFQCSLLKCYGTNNNYYVYKLCDLIFNYTPFTVSIDYICMYMCRVADRFRVYHTGFLAARA